MLELGRHHKYKTEDVFQTLERNQQIAFLYSIAFSEGHNRQFKKAQHFGKDLPQVPPRTDPRPVAVPRCYYSVTVANLDLMFDFYQSLGSLPRIFCTLGLAYISARLKSNSFE